MRHGSRFQASAREKVDLYKINFYARAIGLFRWRFPRARSTIEIVIIAKHLGLVFILVALAVVGQLEAQVDLPVSESETEDQTETTPSPEARPGAPVQIRPDAGSPVAGTELNAPLFDIGRHLYLSGSLHGGYDDNVNLTPNGSPSWYVNPTANVRYLFGSARLAMDLLTGGGISYYIDHPGGRDYDPLVYLNLSIAYKITPRLTLDFSTSSAYEAQPEFGTALSSNRRLGNYLRSENILSAHYRLSPRWSSVTRYDLSVLEYESSSGHDRFEQAFSEELRYLWLPTTTVSGEYRFSLNGRGGAQGNSTTQSLVAGLEQSFSPRLNARLRSGVQLRSGNGGERTSPFVETSLEYLLESATRAASRRSGASTYISWTTRYSIEESDLQRAAGRETFRTNLRLNYAMTARISASLALSYSTGDNQAGSQISNRSLGGSSNESTFDITPSVRYAITQHCSVDVGYRYTDVNRGSGAAALEPLQPFNSYTRNRYFAGITLSF
jgi:opacity protein-like surface antigen